MLLELLFRTPLSGYERTRLALGMKNIFSAFQIPEEKCLSPSFKSQGSSPAPIKDNDASTGHSATINMDHEVNLSATNEAAEDIFSSQVLEALVKVEDAKAHPRLKAMPVPAGKANRVLNYASLAIGMAAGALSETAKRAIRKPDPANVSNVWLSEENANRLVTRLSKMRGAALKLGQLFSMQGADVLPPELAHIFERVRNMAYAMPWPQAEVVLKKNLGASWRDLFSSFDHEAPIAAASIGQVHQALIKDQKVAVKIQYPGVRKSLSSDISSLKTLLLLGNLLPKGLFLEKTLHVLEKELIWETNYLREALWMDWFRRTISPLSAIVPEVFSLKIPVFFPLHSGESVLTTEWVDGLPLDRLLALPQAVRNKIGATILALCFWEIFTLRAMQTDPNWANFLFDGERIVLLDFGAARRFDSKFVEGYRRLVLAAAKEDWEQGYQASLDLKYLTGLESKAMINAHLNSLIVIGLPFRASSDNKFDFSTYSNIVQSIKSSIPVMLEERLTPPPEDTYALHLKLSGVFLLCAKLGAVVDCNYLLRRLVEDVNPVGVLENFDLPPYPEIN